MLRQIVYKAMTLLFRLLMSIFFRSVTTRGTHRIPHTGAVLFVAAPHANQFVDPMILISTCGRVVHMLTAASSMRKHVLGLAAQILGSIPVERPMDHVRPGSGRIKLKAPTTSDDAQPTIVGIATRLRDELRSGDSLLVHHGTELVSVVVDSVVADDELHIRNSLDERTKLILASPDGHPFRILPHLDQSDVYRQVVDELCRGEAIGIFPEGGSHDRAQMLPLKAGVAIMALGALQHDPDLQLVLVPVGLHYFAPHRFRSEAVIHYGSPLSIDAELVAKFARGGRERREAISKVLQTVYSALCEVTVNAPDWETLQVVQAASRLYRPQSTAMNSADRVQLNRRFIKVRRGPHPDRS